MLSYVYLAVTIPALAVVVGIGGLLAWRRLRAWSIGNQVGLAFGLASGAMLLAVAWPGGVWGQEPPKSPAAEAPASKAAVAPQPAPKTSPAAPKGTVPKDPQQAEPAPSKAAPATAAFRDWRQNRYVKLGVALGAIVLPFVLASYLASRWRMPDYFGKIALILFSLLASVAIVVMGWPPRLGIDLRGGVILVYEIQESAPQTAALKEEAQMKDRRRRTATGQAVDVDMDKLIAAVSRRVNPGGVKEVTIRPFGAREIEIIIPEADEAEVARTEKIVSSAGNLEFRILANDRDHKSLIERAQASDADRLFDSEGNLLAWWVPVTAGQERSFQSYTEIATRTRTIRGKQRLEILVVKDPFDVTGAYLAQSRTDVDQTGRPCVNFIFNARGGQLFAQLTSRNLPDDVQNFSRKLGIILDNNLYSAPAIRSTISERGEITGDFTRQETEDLVNVLNAGSLPAALSQEPISRLYTGPTLGRDTIERGLNSIIISMTLVFLSVLVYYRFPGVVACLALLMNGIMLLAIMIMIKAAFTLPGLAGFALTLGMAVDANVLIYERMREEAGRGAGLRMTIRNGFNRALSAIVDSNLTTMITAAVLYLIGTDQIRGFAVTLFLGIVLSMFTAIFCARVVFDIAEKQKWISELKMMRALGETHFDFLRHRKLMIGISVVLILIGLVATFDRGVGLLDIDFTGGVSMQVVFDQPQNIAVLRRELRDLPDLVVSDVQVAGERPGRRFVINTSTPPGLDVEDYLNQVKAKLQKVFHGKLSHNQMSVEQLTEIGAEKPSPAKPPTPIKPSSKAQSRSALPSTRLESAAATVAMLAQAGAAQPKAAVPQKAAPAPSQPRDDRTAPAPSSRFAGGSSARLVFAHRITQAALEQVLKERLLKSKLAKIEYLILNKDGQEEESDQVAAEVWNVLLGLPPGQAKGLLAAVKQDIEAEPFFPSSNTIGGAVAESTRVRAIYALLASTVIILVYLWVRFQRVTYGLGAVISIVHDMLITLGFVAISYYLAPFLGFLLIEPFKINLAMMAAFLTIAGYSLNDTIVIFDRIREVRGKAPYVSEEMINLSINQTLSRTLLTGVTSMMVIVILYIVGGGSIHGFAYAMIIGIVTGTYSSIYIASPLLLWISTPAESRPAGSKRTADVS